MAFSTKFAVLALILIAPAALAQPAPEPRDPPPELTEQAIDSAEFDGWRARMDALASREEPPKTEAKPGSAKAAPDPFLIRLQILLDRAHSSPGVIDGLDGSNLRKAIRAYETMRGMPLGGEPTPEVWKALSVDTAKATKIYEITQEDVETPFVKDLPADYSKLAKLKAISFRDVPEMLAERFHLEEALLKRLNDGADFGKAGTRILVPETGAGPGGKVAKIVIDKKEGEMRAYDKGGAILMAAPATVGSQDTPSPTGKMKINGTFPNPVYIYDPKKNFQQGKNRLKLTLPGGPNGPVGSMWIDLSKPTYGIHGTPEPDKIDKTGSHGCVRLTNWDAEALARIVEPRRTTVTFE